MKISSKTSVFLFTFFTISFATAQKTITPEELNVLIGHWSGSLTYTNYSDGTPFSMPAELEIQTGKNNYQLVLFKSYPKEPKANNKDIIKYSKDGTKINNAPITSFERLPNQQFKVITETLGKDDRKKALIKNVYSFGKSNLVIRKEVKFIGTEDWFVRNEYKFTR